MRPRNRKSKKCIECNKLFGDNKPWTYVKDRKFCSRKCYLLNKSKNANKVFKNYFFKCEDCGEVRKVSYKENWSIKKRGAKKCFKCSRMKKGIINSGSFKKGEHSSKNTEFKGGVLSPKWIDGRASQKDYGSVSAEKRRALKLGNGGSHTVFEWNDLKRDYGYMCLCCKKVEPEIKLVQDHIVPLAKGGTNNIDNIQPLCRHCNAVKHVKIIKY